MEISCFRLLLYFRTDLVYTVIVRKKITFNADKSDIDLARQEARSQNTRHGLFRDWLKWIVGRVRARKYRAMMERLRYADAGRKFTRDEMNER